MGNSGGSKLGLSYSNDAAMLLPLLAFRTLFRLLSLARRCWRTRGFGDFWSYMLVAEGVAEIGCEPVVSLWDLAAPQVIVEEAGGTFTDLAGVATAAGGDALATNGLLHREALALVGR